MRLSSRSLAIVLPILLALSGAALADKCESLSIYTCAKGASNGAYIGGAGTLIASGGAGLFLSGNTFTVSMHNGASGADVVILGASLGTSPTGSLNGTAFTSLTSFSDPSMAGAIVQNLQSTGFCTGSACNTSNLHFGYVDLHTALSANGRITVTAAGVAPGTALYAEVLNSKGQIIYLTANSESGVLGGGTSTVPEPGSLSLLVTGLCGIAGGAWRKLRG